MIIISLSEADDYSSDGTEQSTDMQYSEDIVIFLNKMPIIFHSEI